MNLTPVVRRRRGEPVFDAANRPTYPTVDTDLPAAGFAPNGGVGGFREPIAVGRNLIRSGGVCYFPCEVDVVASDELIVNGKVWQVDGDAEVWRNPFRSHAFKVGTVVHLKSNHEAE